MMLRAYIGNPFMGIAALGLFPYIGGLGQGFVVSRLVLWFGILRPLDIEEDLADRIGNDGIFIAISDKTASYGATKLLSTDDEWRTDFELLAERAAIIFLYPGMSQHVIWKVNYILERPILRDKTVWIMPRVSGAQWELIRLQCQEDLKVVLPLHASRLGYFRIGENFSTSPMLPHKQFLRKVNKILKNGRDLPPRRTYGILT